MEYAQLSGTELQVSRIGFGCEPLGGTDWGKVDQDLAMAAVSKALELGVNCFDTADVYGLGQSERVLSEALGTRRHEAIIASKFGINWEDNPSRGRAETFLDSSSCRVQKALEGSLRRLQVDAIPLYFIHCPDPNTPLGDTITTLIQCQKAGRIEHIGVSNFAPDQIREAAKMVNVAAVQLLYNLIERRAERELLPCCQELGISVFAYGTLAQGLLTGKYGTDTQFGPGDRRHRLPHFEGENLKKNLQIVERLKKVGERYHKSPAQVAIRWVLENPAVSCAIVGAKSPAQIEHNVGALGWSLAPEDYEYITAGNPI